MNDWADVAEHLPSMDRTLGNALSTAPGEQIINPLEEWNDKMMKYQFTLKGSKYHKMLPCMSLAARMLNEIHRPQSKTVCGFL